MRGTRWDFGSQRTRKKSLEVPDPKSRSGAAIFMETCLRILFSHVFCNKSPHAESVILHFSKRSVEAVLRRVAIRFFKKQLFSKKNVVFFVFCVWWDFVMDTSTQASIWSPFGRRFSAP